MASDTLVPVGTNHDSVDVVVVDVLADGPVDCPRSDRRLGFDTPFVAGLTDAFDRLVSEFLGLLDGLGIASADALYWPAVHHEQPVNPAVASVGQIGGVVDCDLRGFAPVRLH